MINGKVGTYPLDDLEQDCKEYRKTATVWATQMEKEFVVDTEEGSMKGLPGDYLLQGPAGEAWPCKRDIFEATYEEASDGGS